MLVKKAPLMWGLYCTPFQSDRELHGLSEGTGNNILLLFFGQGVKTYGVARYADDIFPGFPSRRAAFRGS